MNSKESDRYFFSFGRKNRQDGDNGRIQRSAQSNRFGRGSPFDNKTFYNRNRRQYSDINRQKNNGSGNIQPHAQTSGVPSGEDGPQRGSYDRRSRDDPYNARNHIFPKEKNEPVLASRGGGSNHGYNQYHGSAHNHAPAYGFPGNFEDRNGPSHNNNYRAHDTVRAGPPRSEFQRLGGAGVNSSARGSRPPIPPRINTNADVPIESTNDDVEDTDWGPKRRQRGYVPNGKIAKRKRVDEYDNEDKLFCDVCNISFRDISEKLAHEIAKSHNKGVSIKRAELIEKRHSVLPTSLDGQSQQNPHLPNPITMGAPSPAQPQQTPVTMTSTASVDAQNEREVGSSINDNKLDAGVERLLRKELGNLSSVIVPQSFKAWINKSIAAAKTTASANKDPKHIALVQKEVAYQMIRHHQACSLWRVNWERMPFATGSVIKARNDVLPRLTIHQVKSMDERAKPDDNSTNDNDDETPAKDDLELAADAKSSEEQSVHTQRTRASAVLDRHWVRDADLEPDGSMSLDTSVPVPSLSTSAVAADALASNLQDTVADAAATQSTFATPLDVSETSSVSKLFSYRRSTVRLCERAHFMMRSLAMVSFDAVARGHYKLTSRHKTEENKGDLQELVDKFNRVDEEVKSKKYQFEDAWSVLDTIATQLSKVGLRQNTMQKCLKLQVLISIEARDFKKVAMPACKLMKSFNEYGTGEKEDSGQFVAYWLMSLLFKEALSVRTAAKINRPSAALLLASSLRYFPRYALRSAVVFHMKEAFRAVLSNNWVSFFQVLHNNLIHDMTQGNTRAICVAYAEFVRERALMTMLRVAISHNQKVYDGPPLVPLDYIMRVLGYGGVENHADDGEIVDEELTMAQEFAKSLPQKIEVLGCPEDGRMALLRANDQKATIRDSTVVHVKLVLEKSACQMGMIRAS